MSYLSNDGKCQERVSFLWHDLDLWAILRHRKGTYCSQQILSHLFREKYLVFRNLLSLWHHSSYHRQTDGERTFDRSYSLRAVLFLHFMFPKTPSAKEMDIPRRIYGNSNSIVEIRLRVTFGHILFLHQITQQSPSDFYPMGFFEHINLSSTPCDIFRSMIYYISYITL